MIFALFLAVAATQPQFNKPFKLSGMGNESCTTAFADQHELEAVQWIAGFLSGVNSQAGGSIGNDADLAGLAAEVRNDCAKEPSRPLAWATMQTYKRLRAPVRSR